jgi:ribosomal protein S18 acetylase RimI-like enzyme
MVILDYDPAIRLDKAGRSIRYRLISVDERPAFIDFYSAFEPKGVYQGLPPLADHLEKWLDGLLAHWVNLGAFHQHRLVGHSALDCVGEGAVSEYLIFVSPDYQNQGIGTSLTQYAMALAQWAHGQKVWLIVQNSNLRAIKVYRRAGFHFTGPFADEREMVLLLSQLEDT